jgi:hypothetical protein
MFCGAKAFNQPLDRWQVSNVSDMSSVFERTHVFNQPLNTWNVQYVQTMYGLFQDAYSFNQPLDGWCIENVEITAFMFANACAFTRFDSLHTWRPMRVNNMANMFYEAGKDIYSMEEVQDLVNEVLECWDIDPIETNLYAIVKTYYL